MSVCPLKTLGQAGHFKNGWIWLKFCTLASWVNTLGIFLIYFKIFIFGALRRVLVPKRGWKLWGMLDTSKMVRFDWNFSHTCSLSEYLGLCFPFFQNFHFWSLGTSFSAKTRLKTLAQAEHFKNDSIWLKFCTLAPEYLGAFFIFSKF